MIWSSRPANPLPVLMIVTNNQWGISTAAAPQHGEQNIADRGRAFGIKCRTIDGNDPEVAWAELQAAMEYVRTERKPFLLEAKLSRLYGHSSASGANPVGSEADCLSQFEETLVARGLRTRGELDQQRARYTAALSEAHRRVITEPQPEGSSIYDHVFQTRDLVRGG